MTRIFPAIGTVVLDTGARAEPLTPPEAGAALEQVVNMLAQTAGAQVDSIKVTEFAEGDAHKYQIEVSFKVGNEARLKRLEYLREFVTNMRKELEAGESLIRMLSSGEEIVTSEAPNEAEDSDNPT